MNPRAHIISTIGPASCSQEVIEALISAGADVARMNFAWQTLDDRGEYVAAIRAAAAERGKRMPIIADLPGPRVKKTDGHTYDVSLPSLTEEDEKTLAFCVEVQIEYIALSFVGTAEDVTHCREVLKKLGGNQKIIAKIERKVALDSIDAILVAADALMVARGDLGAEVPLEQIPFIEKDLIMKANAAGKPVIVATQMMLSMTEHAEPTRAEVTDVEEAVVSGADGVMLSEETASGKYPVEAVAMMERIIRESEKHIPKRASYNFL